MDGAGGGTAIFFGMMLAGLFYFLAHMNFHLLATKITSRTDPSKTTRVWAHVAAILTAWNDGDNRAVTFKITTPLYVIGKKK